MCGHELGEDPDASAEAGRRPRLPPVADRLPRRNRRHRYADGQPLPTEAELGEQATASAARPCGGRSRTWSPRASCVPGPRQGHLRQRSTTEGTCDRRDRSRSSWRCRSDSELEVVTPPRSASTSKPRAGCDLETDEIVRLTFRRVHDGRRTASRPPTCRCRWGADSSRSPTCTTSSSSADHGAQHRPTAGRAAHRRRRPDDHRRRRIGRGGGCAGMLGR